MVGSSWQKFFDLLLGLDLLLSNSNSTQHEPLLSLLHHLSPSTQHALSSPTSSTTPLLLYQIHVSPRPRPRPDDPYAKHATLPELLHLHPHSQPRWRPAALLPCLSPELFHPPLRTRIRPPRLGDQRFLPVHLPFDSHLSFNYKPFAIATQIDVTTKIPETFPVEVSPSRHQPRPLYIGKSNTS